MRPDARRPRPHIAIIGAGFSGICLGIQLLAAGFRDFTILEKSEGPGGTWRDNTYPGAACDLQSFAYCFSFEQKTDWSRRWSPQPEILAYLEHCVRSYGLGPHLRTGAEVEAARFDAEAGVWRVRLASGEQLEAEVLVSGVGQLHRPHVPDLPGLGDFLGASFHSARWRHDVELAGKDVAVIGNAASAIQFIPKIAPRVRRLHVLQRSANWMLPKGDRAFRSREKWIFGHVPLAARLQRWRIWLTHELWFYPVMRGNNWVARGVEKLARRHIEAQVADPELRRALVPDYPIGARRALISDDYYPALQRANVELVTSPIERIVADGVVTRDGRRHPAQVLIFATGFESTSFLAPIKIEGLGGRRLDEAWKDGAEAYLGLAVPGFPNFFLMYGPNTNLGHNSIVFMIECQSRYIVDALRQMAERGLHSIELREDVMRTFQARLERALAKTVWARTDHSWYKTRSGRITNNWSGTTISYWWKTRRAKLAAYRLVARSEAPAPHRSGAS